jgi:Uma2 family endonuclease
MELKVPKQRFSVAEYLERERKAVDKHEYRDGEILLMAGGSRSHSLMIANVIAALHSRLQGKPCRVYDSNLRVQVPRKVLYTYPDVSVICGQSDPDENDPAGDTVTNPRLIVEVLSDSTEAYDRGKKFDGYRELESLQEYVLVSQEAPRVETFFRQPDGTWLLTPVSGLNASVRLRSIETEVALAAIYQGVEFPAA